MYASKHWPLSLNDNAGAHSCAGALPAGSHDTFPDWLPRWIWTAWPAAVTSGTTFDLLVEATRCLQRHLPLPLRPAPPLPFLNGNSCGISLDGISGASSWWSSIQISKEKIVVSVLCEIGFYAHVVSYIMICKIGFYAHVVNWMLICRLSYDSMFKFSSIYASLKFQCIIELWEHIYMHYHVGFLFLHSRFASFVLYCVYMHPLGDFGGAC